MIRLNDFRDDDLWKLFQECAAGDLEAVKRLVEARPDLATAEYNYTPAIHFAVREGRVEIARYLIDKGAKVADYRSYPFQDSLLTIAEDREDAATIELLREIAARRYPVAPGFAAFLDAVRRGDGDAVRAALAQDAGLARGSDDTGDTALHRAAERGDIETMGLLLDAGAAVDAVRADGDRPIHGALHRGRKPAAQSREAANFLLARGSAYNIYLAAVFGDADYVKAALARDRALANYTDTQWWRPITAAARRDDFEMVKMLLDHGADPTFRRTARPWARPCGLPSTTRSSSWQSCCSNTARIRTRRPNRAAPL